MCLSWPAKLANLSIVSVLWSSCMLYVYMSREDKFNDMNNCHLQELQSKERSLQQRILEQEKKEKQLNREKEEVQRKAERLEMLIRRLSEQQSLDDTQEEEEEPDSQPHPLHAPPTDQSQNQQQEVSVPRPPRLKPFSIRGLIKRLWNDRSGATKGRKVEGPLPSRVETRQSKVTRRLMSSPDQSSRQRHPVVERREKRSMTTSLATPDAPAFSTLPAEKRASLPNVSQQQHDRTITMMRGHRRLGSDDLKGKILLC